MRLWSIDPTCLDTKGLLAVWREGLLAQKVLQGLTTGYRNHPQLVRFRASPDPILAIGCYLDGVEQEARRRGYTFDRTKIVRSGDCPKIPVQQGQVEYEWERLLEKVRIRDAACFEANKALAVPAVHPLFVVVPGGIEDWEKV